MNLEAAIFLARACNGAEIPHEVVRLLAGRQEWTIQRWSNFQNKWVDSHLNHYPRRLIWSAVRYRVIPTNES